jgi:general secretion pathway protein A
VEKLFKARTARRIFSYAGVLVAPMYEKHFGLHSAPFSITPDPRFVYLSQRHREGLAHLLYGLGQAGSGGFVVLTGEVGTGKTTLCRLALEQLPNGTEVALILNPLLNPTELLESINEELKLDVSTIRGQNKALIDQLNQHLLAQHASGKRVVLMLDEAQNFSTAALEQVRLLTNLETATQKLLQIILLGQPELNAVLAKPELRQLNQRVTARFHLTALTEAESATYIAHRLSVAGNDQAIFSAPALKRLHQLSQGTPRVLNILADHSLLAAFAAGKRSIDPATVNKAAHEVLPGFVPKADLAFAKPVWFALAALSALLFCGWLWRSTQAIKAVLPAESSAMPAAAPASNETQNAAALNYLRTMGYLQPALDIAPLRDKLLACAARWDARYACYRGRMPVAFLRKLQHPVLYLQNGALHGQSLPAGELAPEFIALYRKPVDAPEQIANGYAGPGVPELALALAARDGLEAKQTIYGPRMAQRVEQLQLDMSLPPDGIAGPHTWLALQAELMAFDAQ